MLALIAVTFLVGCASSGAPVGVSNYRERLTIEREDVTYYAGKYIGTEKGCFPPITQRLCRTRLDDEALYATTKALDMESFELALSVRSSHSVGNGNPVKDFLYLAASDFALQRGYAMFTTLNESVFWVCNSGTDAQTSGIISTGPYGQSRVLATTTASPTSNCSGTRRLKVLLFRDKDDLALGVLKIQHSGMLASTSAWPVIDLYQGSIPGLKPRKDIISSSIIQITDINENAWKVHFDAPLLSKDLRAKYQLTDTSPYTFVEEREVN